jgi:hypothetical protein
MDLSGDDVQQRAEADRRDVDPPIQGETATWSKAGQLDWWVKERREWWSRVRGADGRQKWIRAVDLRRRNRDGAYGQPPPCGPIHVRGGCPSKRRDRVLSPTGDPPRTGAFSPPVGGRHVNRNRQPRARDDLDAPVSSTVSAPSASSKKPNRRVSVRRMSLVRACVRVRAYLG